MLFKVKLSFYTGGIACEQGHLILKLYKQSAREESQWSCDDTVFLHLQSASLIYLPDKWLEMYGWQRIKKI